MFERFEIVGHRGAAAYAPENTMSSFKKAVELGATSVEFDLRLTADGRVVVIHDEHVDRTTNGRGKVSDLTHAQLCLLDAGGWYSPEYKRTRIPLFSDELKYLNGKVGAMIEIKDEVGWEDEKNIFSVLSIIEKYGSLKQVEIISFNHSIVRQFKIMESNLKTGILYRHNSIDWLRAAQIARADVIHPILPRNTQLDEALIAKAHNHNLVVLATSNSKSEIKRLVQIGADGICSDHPDWVVDVAKKV